MAMPKSVTRINKNGITFTENVDALQYTLTELTRAALRDSGKLVVKIAKENAPKRTGKGRKAIQYFVKRKDTSVQVGIKPSGWYMTFHELGTKKFRKQAFLTNAVHNNIEAIRTVQAKYLSGINDPGVESIINEDDYGGEAD